MTPPVTWRLLRAVLDVPEPRWMNLYAEVCRATSESAWRPHQLLALSARLTPRGLLRNRYDSPLTWSPARGPEFYDIACRAAPTAAVARWLADAACPARAWVAAPPRWFNYLAVDFDRRVYKLYRFLDKDSAFLEDLDLAAPREALRASSYIDCLEIDLDRPARAENTLYFKVRVDDPARLVDPGFRPHAALVEPPLSRLPARHAAAEAIASILRGRTPPVEPVVKVRWDQGPVPVGAFSVNLTDARAPVRVAEHAPALLALAEAVGCATDVRSWSDVVAGFDGYLSYLCVGPDFVTLYYKSGSDAE